MQVIKNIKKNYSTIDIIFINPIRYRKYKKTYLVIKFLIIYSIFYTNIDKLKIFFLLKFNIDTM